MPTYTGIKKLQVDSASGLQGSNPVADTVKLEVSGVPQANVTNLVSDLSGKVPTTRTISTTAPLTGGGDLSANRTLDISTFGGDSGLGGSKGAVPAPAAGDAAAGKFLKADATWATPSGGPGGGISYEEGLGLVWMG